MPNTITLKQHDLEPSPKATLLRGTGSTAAPIDLTTAIAVTAVLRPVSGGTPIRRAATIESAANGSVSFQWQTGDTDTPGAYFHEWEITWPGNRPQTVPHSKYNVIVIEADLG